MSNRGLGVKKGTVCPTRNVVTNRGQGRQEKDMYTQGAPGVQSTDVNIQKKSLKLISIVMSIRGIFGQPCAGRASP